MDKIDSRTLPVEALNERRRRAVKMRLDGVSLKQTPTQCELSRTTVIAAVKAFHEGGWKAVMVNQPGRPAGTGRTPMAEQEREVQCLDPRPHGRSAEDGLRAVDAPGGVGVDPGPLRHHAAGAHDGVCI
jgi:hypothetical protein